MGFSGDAATPCLWVGNIKPGLQKDVVFSVFASFGAIRRIKQGPAPPGTSATGLAAEIHFSSIAQAAAALTALNAIVVPRLSGHHPLAIQCWQPSGSSSHAAPAPAPARPVTALNNAGQRPAVHAAAPAARAPQGPQQDVRPSNLADAASAVELPGADDLSAALEFFEACCFRAVPEEERCSAAKWAVLQALLGRGLHHLGGCTFRQLPVLLTHVGDELLKYRGSNPAVESEYQSFPASGRLTSLVRDIKAPGLVAVHAEGAGANTAQVQLHLGRLALLGGAPGGGAPGGGGSAAHSSSAAPAPPPAPAPKPQPRPGSAGLQGYKPSAMPLTQYSVRNVPSRHLVLLGVTVQADVARLTGIARQHGTLEKYFCNPRKSAMTLHFSTTEAAKNMAREVEGHAVPGLQSPGPLEVAYKHPVAVAAGAGAQQPKAAAKAAAQQPKAAAKAAKPKEPPQQWQYSATLPSCVLRVKKLSSAADRQGLAQVGQAVAGGNGLKDCTFFPSSGIGYLFFSSEAAASAAAAALRGGDLPWSQGAEELIVEFRHPASTHLDGTSPATAAAAHSSAAAAAPEVPPCCACCGASGEGAALSRCSGCRVVHYCGRDCQLKDWAAQHASECPKLQQMAAALQAAHPSAGGSQLQLLVAALRSPGGREAGMLRVLLGSDAAQAGSSGSMASTAVAKPAGVGPAEGAASGGDGGTPASTEAEAAAADGGGSQAVADAPEAGEALAAAAEGDAEEAVSPGSGSGAASSEAGAPAAEPHAAAAGSIEEAAEEDEGAQQGDAEQQAAAAGRAEEPPAAADEQPAADERANDGAAGTAAAE